MNDKLVSVITPCYNGSRYLEQTILSVLKQTYKDWEMIIIDDGSTDNSVSIIEQFMSVDPRIKLIRQKNSGSAAARNNGIKEAEGRYIALLDADDLWDPEFLESQINTLRKNSAVVVYCAYRRIDPDSYEILKPIPADKPISIKDMNVMNRIGCLSGLYDSKKYGKKYLDEDLKSIRDDYAYWYSIVSLEDKAVNNPRILASYRIDSNSTTGNKKKLILPQYNFYRNYLSQNSVISLWHTFRWGLAGLSKYIK